MSIARRTMGMTRSGADSVVGAEAPPVADHVAVLAAVIVRDALGNPARETTANRWRPLLPAGLGPHMVGATVQRLIAAGVLVPTGRYVRSTDRVGKNHGKPQAVYRLELPT